MILKNATIRYSNNDLNILSKGSNKRICVSCDMCGRVRWVMMQNYRDLCHKCASKIRSGKNHHFYNKFGSNHPRGGKSSWNKGLTKDNNKSLKIVSEKNKNKLGDLNPHYKLEIDKFIKDNQHKHFCQCGCGEKIDILRSYYNIGIPKFIHGHFSKGENNPNYGKFGKDASGWKGGISTIDRSHVLPFSQCLKINKYFKGSHRHHISADVIIYIPRDLHYHIKHSLKNNYGMYEMNLLSLQYLKGWL